MTTRRYIVTGAGGFIGSALCRRLRSREGGRVRALLRSDRSGPWDETIIADLETDQIPPGAFAGVDIVFHLAGKTHAVSDLEDDEESYWRVNVGGTKKILEACRQEKVRRFVFVSSVKAMGEGGPECIDENTDPRPTTAYGRSKREAEELVLTGGLIQEPVVLRLALVYGPGNKGNLAKMIDAIAAGAFPPVPKTLNRRSMVHVDDVVQAAVLAGESENATGKVFIVSDGHAYSTREIYESICRVLNKPVPGWTMPVLVLKALAKTGDWIGRKKGSRWKFDTAAYEKLLGSACYDNTALKRTLGFAPKWDLQSALPDIIRDGRRT